jgi:hypothetical protein
LPNYVNGIWSQKFFAKISGSWRTKQSIGQKHMGKKKPQQSFIETESIKYKYTPQNVGLGPNRWLKRAPVAQEPCYFSSEGSLYTLRGISKRRKS